jgi:hypothetical protein
MSGFVSWFFLCPPKDCGNIRAAFGALPVCPRARPPLGSAGNFPVSLAQVLNQLPSPLPVLQETQGNEHLYCMYRPHVKTTAYYRRSKHAAKKIKPSTVLMSRSKSFPRATRKVLSARHSDSDVLHTFQFFNFLWLGEKLLGTKEFSRSEKRLLLSAPFLHVRDVFDTSTHSQPGGVVRVALKLAVLATPWGLVCFCRIGGSEWFLTELLL